MVDHALSNRQFHSAGARMTRDIDQFMMPLKTRDEFRADYTVQDNVVRDLREMHGLDACKEIDQLLEFEYTHYVQRTLARRVQDHVDYVKWEIETDVDAAKDVIADMLRQIRQSVVIASLR